MKKDNITWDRYEELAEDLCSRWRHHPHITHVYGVPNGGGVVAFNVAEHLDLKLVESYEGIHLKPWGALFSQPGSCLVVDDLVDSGRTMRPYKDAGFPCDALCRKQHAPPDLAPSAFLADNQWVVFPWEGHGGGPEDAIVRILEYIGENPEREGLQETPARVVKSFHELYSGYGSDPKDVMKTFASDGYQEMVMLKDVEIYSMCEHHMLPFMGKAHIAYIPGDRIIGISKLARLMEIYARRLQNQERLCSQVTTALMEHLHPAGAACVIEARHLCSCARGVAKQNSIMVTSSLKGVFLDEGACRSEFMSLIR